MIEIENLRVSPDGAYIEVIANCPAGYHFNRFEIKRYNRPEDAENAWQDLVSVVEADCVRLVKRISVGIGVLGTVSTMFYVNLGIIIDNYVEGVSPEPETVIACCSDVTTFYFAIHDKLQSLSTQEIPLVEFDLLMRGYMNLWAHQETMRLERYDDAERYYTRLTDFVTETGYEKRELEARLFDN